MFTLMRTTLVVILLLMATPKLTAGQSLDDFLADYDAASPGVLVGIVRHGELVDSAAAGMSDLRFQVPMTPTRLANIGSTAKQFTGMALALLHERGELSLDDDVRDYIPELPEFGHKVTLRHLLTHTSGYREFINAEALAGVRIEKGDWMDREVLIKTVQSQTGLQNEPGTEWNYNNTGYGLLAEVVERATGKPFPHWVKTEIFDPIGMDSTHFRLHPDRVIADANTGYSKDGNSYLEARDIGAALGAGGVYTTLNDMARWMRHLGSFELGGENVRNHMTTPYELNDGESTAYGFGLMINRFRGLQRWQHGGGDAGHMSVFDYFPEHDAGYIILANHHGIDANFMHAVAEITLGEHLEPRTDAEDGASVPAAAEAPGEFSDELFDRYAGRYELDIMPGFVLHFFRDGEKYMIQGSGQPAFEIEPVAANEFAQAMVGVRVVFHLDDEGQANELTLHQNGQHRAVRIAEEESSEMPDLNAFAGRYLSKELETFYTITVVDEQLQLAHRRFGPLTLHHSRDDQFNGAFPTTNIEFTRDEDGRITGLKAGNGRARDVLFERIEE